MILYKYTDINKYSKDSLKHKYFYCSRPRELNDIFDCHIPILHEYRDSSISEWLKFQSFMDMINKSTRRKSRKIPFSTIDEVKNSYKDGSFDDFVYKNILNKEINHFHILSLSKQELNEILWGTYANSHKGICIGYEANDFDENSKCYKFKIEDVKFEKFLYFTKDKNATYFNIYNVNYSNEKTNGYNFIGLKHGFFIRA